MSRKDQPAEKRKKINENEHKRVLQEETRKKKRKTEFEEKHYEIFNNKMRNQRKPKVTRKKEKKRMK